MPTDAQRRQQASAHHAEVQALNERIALLEQQLAEARKDSSPGGATICAYKIGSGMNAIRIEQAEQMVGPALWAVRRGGNCFGYDGWEWEPMPSSRDDEFIRRCRYESAEKAIDAAITRTQEQTP